MTSIVIVAISLGQFLFTPGYYLYSDQFWPIDPNYSNTEAFSTLLYTKSGRLSTYAFPQFTRDIISWPWTLIQGAIPSYQGDVRVFVLYSFLLFLVLAWVLAELLVRSIENRMGRRIEILSRWLIQLFVVVAAYANFLSIDLNADGGTVSDGLILLLLSIALLVVTTRVGWTAGFAVGLVLSTILLLDPDYYITALAAIVVTTFVAGVLARSLILHLSSTLFGAVLSLPVLLFVFEGLKLVGPSGSLESVRAISQAASLSRNLTAWSAISLYGFSWSTVTFGPPTVSLAGGSISTYSSWGTPAILVLPPGPETTAWLIAGVALPALSFSSLLLPRRTGRLTLPVFGAGLAGLLSSFYAGSQTLTRVLTAAANLPVIGPAIGTSFAVPDHFLIVSAAAYLILAPTTLCVFSLAIRQPHRLSQRSDTQPPPPARVTARLQVFRGRAALWPRITAVVAIGVILFAGWQAFDGSFSPARADYSTFSGNGVPTFGAYTPYSVSNATLQTYDFLDSQPVGFNVYWPVGYGIQLSRFWEFSPSANLPDLRTLLASDLPGDVAPYLAAHSVKYIVVQDQLSPPQFYTPIDIPAAYGGNPYLYYFGLGNYSEVVSFFSETPGIELSFVTDGIRVFGVQSDVSLTRPASILLRAPTSEGLVATTYALFDSLGQGAAISGTPGYGLPLEFGSVGEGAGVFTPLNLSQGFLVNASLRAAPLPTTLSAPEDGVRYSANTSSLTGAAVWTQNHSLGQYESDESGFYFTDWAGDFSVRIANGSVSVYSQGGATFTLDYAGPATYLSSAIEVTNTSAPLESMLISQFNLSSPRTAAVSGTFVAVNATSSSTLAFSSFPAIANSAGYSVQEVNDVPRGTQYFTYRLGGTFSGYFNISYYNVSVGIVPVDSDPTAPFGYAMHLVGTNLRLPTGGENVSVLAVGGGRVDGIPSNASVSSFLSIGRSDSISVNGTVDVLAVVSTPGRSLAQLEANYLVYNGADASGVLIRQDGVLISPILTDYGTNLYLLRGTGSFSLVAPGLLFLQQIYGLVVVYVVAMGLLCFRKLRVRGRRAGLNFLGVLCRAVWRRDG